MEKVLYYVINRDHIKIIKQNNKLKRDNALVFIKYVK